MVPVEHMSHQGVEPSFGARLAEQRALPEGWVELLSAAVAQYVSRVSELFARAPGDWFSPRLQNLCIVTDPEAVRPYVQPIANASMLLYQSDFDPAHSNLELATYMLVHSERLCLTRRMTPTVVRNLSWFLARTREQTDAFVAAARSCPRPDGAAFARLAAAMPYVRRLHHTEIHPLTSTPSEPLDQVEGTQLLVPKSVQPEILRVAESFEAEGARTLKAFFHRQSQEPKKGARDRLCQRLADERPPVLVVDARGSVVWDPHDPTNVRLLRKAVASVHGLAADSIADDLAVIGARTRAFLAAARDVDALPRSVHDVEENDGIYLRADRRLIAYALEQPGMSPLREPAPPYHRWLVAARTAHEWGHLAAEAGWVGVVDPAAHGLARERLGALLRGLAADAPASVKAELTHHGGAEALVDRFETRISDYQANLVARTLLTPEELEAYVRSNVTEVDEPGLSTFEILLRYAYEFQYLHLSGIDDPLGYLLTSTRFQSTLVASGLLPRERVPELMETAGAVCRSYAIDPLRFTAPA